MMHGSKVVVISVIMHHEAIHLASSLFRRIRLCDRYCDTSEQEMNNIFVCKLFTSLRDTVVGRNRPGLAEVGVD